MLGFDSHMLGRRVRLCWFVYLVDVFRYSFRVEHGFKMAEVLDNMGAVNSSKLEEEEVAVDLTEDDAEEFTMSGLRSDVTKGLR